MRASAYASGCKSTDKLSYQKCRSDFYKIYAFQCKSNSQNVLIMPNSGAIGPSQINCLVEVFTFISATRGPIISTCAYVWLRLLLQIVRFGIRALNHNAYHVISGSFALTSLNVKQPQRDVKFAQSSHILLPWIMSVFRQSLYFQLRNHFDSVLGFPTHLWECSEAEASTQRRLYDKLFIFTHEYTKLYVTQFNTCIFHSNMSWT